MRQSQMRCRSHAGPLLLDLHQESAVTLMGKWKRLDTLYDPRRRRPNGEWRKAKRRWSRMGIDPDQVVQILKRATSYRQMHEDMLETLPNQRADTRFWLRRARKVERALKQASPLIEIIKHERDFFGQLGVTIEKEVRSYIWQLPIGMLRSRHRPGERWLVAVVPELFGLFKSHSATRKEAIQLIHEALSLDGHNDVVTIETIRHHVYPRRRKAPPPQPPPQP